MNIKMRFVVFFCLAFLFMNQCVFAAYCGKDDFERIKNVANDISIEYSLREDSDVKGMYDIIVTGLTSELYIKETSHDIVIAYDGTDNGTYILEGISGDNYTFEIYYERCASTLVRTITLNVPKYNSLSESPLCDGISGEDLDVCDEWYQGDLDEDKFNESIEEYNKNLQKEQIEETFNKVIEFFKGNFIYMISAIAIVAAIIIVIYIKKKRSALD